MHHTRARRLTLIAVAAGAAAAACGSSRTEPASQAQPVPAPRMFMSQRYSFRVTLAGQWSERDASVAWNGKKLQGLGSAAFANFTDPATGRTLVAAAARVAKGTPLGEWRAEMVRAAPPVSSESSSARHTTLDGEPALAWTSTASDGYHVHKLAALHAARGYMIFLASPTGDNDAENRRVFESMRRSFRFTR